MKPTSRTEHDLYKRGDTDAPLCVQDSNGEVALDLCRKCGRGESELVGPCEPRVSWTSGSSPQADFFKVREDLFPGSMAASIAADMAADRHDNNNPLWRGPCGQGPLGGITQSMIVRFLSCRERFRLKYVLGLEPHDRWNKNLGYGNMWHVAEEAFAANKSWKEAVGVYLDEEARRYPLEREEIMKWGNVCAVQFPEYIKYWADHADVKGRTPLMQEQVFDIPYHLPSGRVVRLRGKFDSVDLIACEQCGGKSAAAICQECNGVGGRVYLQENKTKSDIDHTQVERQLSFDLQTCMYIVALSAGWPPGTPCLPPGAWDNGIKGVRYNVVRRPLSGGKGSIKPHAAKSTKTKFTPAESSQEFYERLRRDYIADDPAYWFFRVRVEVSARDIEVFRDTCLDPLLETVCSWYESVVGRDEFVAPPMNYRTPFGVWSALEENGATEYDHFLATGSEVMLRRVNDLFPELK